MTVEAVPPTPPATLTSAAPMTLGAIRAHIGATRSGGDPETIVAGINSLELARHPARRAAKR